MPLSSSLSGLSAGGLPLARQGTRAAMAAILCLAFAALGGRPGWLPWLATMGLVPPLLLALAGFRRPLPSRLDQTGLMMLAGLIGVLMLPTGGVASPFAIWLALVPAEAALDPVSSRTGSTDSLGVMRAGLAAILILLLVDAAQAFSLLPPAHLVLAPWQAFALVAPAALVAAAWIAHATRRRRALAERTVLEGAAMYRFLADHAMDMITRHSADGRIRFASPAATTLLGRDPEELVGLAPATLAHPEDREGLQTAFVECAYFGRPARAEARLRRGDGGYAWVEMLCRPGAGDAADIVAVTRDIGERKAQQQVLVAARDAAESASRAKTAFLANMSHELRTPLNAIIGFSDIMGREMFGPLGGARYREYAALIHESGGHLLGLINDVLDMSKIEAGRFTLHEACFDLAQTAQAALRLVAPAAERGRVVLECACAPGAAEAFADRRAVTQILLNLLSNGVKFTPPGGTVALDILRRDAGLEIAVADTGFGIAPADLARLGRPFQQVEGAPARIREGTGLGLALVKSLAAMHGGTLELSSALGEGTRALVRLPRAAVTPAQPGRVLPFRGAA